MKHPAQHITRFQTFPLVAGSWITDASGKEKDKETGYSYTLTALSTSFGARYYSSELSVWLSRKLSGVDPLASKYPSTSPFMYVLGNPVAFVDPNGMNHDYYEHIDGNGERSVIYRNGHAATVTVDGEEYKNIGSTYSAKMSNGKTVHFVQDTEVAISDSDKSFGEVMQDTKQYKHAIKVANQYDSQTVQDVYNKAVHCGTAQMSQDAALLMGGIMGSVMIVDGAVMLYTAAEGAVAAAGTIDDAVNLVMKDPNKLSHIFNPKHNLAPLVEQLGGQENTIRAVLNASKGILPSGIFNNLPVSVIGRTVYISGNTVNGVIRLGTMYIP